MTFPFVKRVMSEEETLALAGEFSDILEEGNTIAFNGDLGTGKTFFIKALCRKFQIEEGSSPTFSLVNVYEGKRKIYHFDFYRIESEKELYDIGILEYFNDEKANCFIEWANLFKDVLPKSRYEVTIQSNSDFSRTFTIDKI